jgi:ATP-dependent RNA helicase DeaD
VNNFNELLLPQQLADALKAMEYHIPTPIQVEAIPVALSNRDIIGCAQTGTGKTAAFGIPLIVHLLKSPRKRALVLVPTRELAAQVNDVLAKLACKIPGFKSALLIGGAAMRPQIKALGLTPRIIVATPGRLIDHVRQGNVSLSAMEYLVLDEADRMLDMGFAPQLNEILRFLPKCRQTLLFSATMPNDILKLAQKYLKDPVRVTIGSASTPVKAITQEVVHTTGPKKNECLAGELNARLGSVLVFARTKMRTDRVARHLMKLGYGVTRIHGDRTQRQRTQAIDDFRAGKFRIMIATDIAARGIDIPHIAHVINYDLPQCPEDYIHRIGRTARAGATGKALAILTPEDKKQWHEISRLIQRN